MFPATEKLLTLERKYGDSLNTEDLTGTAAKPKKKKVLEGEGGSALSATAADGTKTATAFAGDAS